MNERDLNSDRVREVLLKLDVTQYAKGEIQIVKGELREDVRLQKEELRSQIHKDRRWVIGAFALLVGGSILSVWGFVQRVEDGVQKVLQAEVEKNRQHANEVLHAETSKMQKQVDDRLNEEFKTPRIHQLIEAEARRYTANEAKSYISAQVEASLNPYRKRVEQATNDLSHFQGEVRQFETQHRTDYEKLAKATGNSENLLQKLDRRNKLAALEGNAINTGDRASLEILETIASDSKETEEFKEAAGAGISRVKAFWISVEKNIGTQINWKGSDGKPKTENQLTTCDLLFELKNNERSRAFDSGALDSGNLRV